MPTYIYDAAGFKFNGVTVTFEAADAPTVVISSKSTVARAQSDTVFGISYRARASVQRARSKATVNLLTFNNKTYGYATASFNFNGQEYQYEVSDAPIITLTKGGTIQHVVSKTIFGNIINARGSISAQSKTAIQVLSFYDKPIPYDVASFNFETEAFTYDPTIFYALWGKGTVGAQSKAYVEIPIILSTKSTVGQVSSKTDIIVPFALRTRGLTPHVQSVTDIFIPQFRLVQGPTLGEFSLTGRINVPAVIDTAVWTPAYESEWLLDNPLRLGALLTLGAYESQGFIDLIEANIIDAIAYTEGYESTGLVYQGGTITIDTTLTLEGFETSTELHLVMRRRGLMIVQK